MSDLLCGRCGAARDSDDNFCRRCGAQITVNLPAVRQSSVPAPARVIPPSLVGSVAVLAVGTGLEWLARRLAGNAARSLGQAAGRALTPNRTQPAAKKSGSDDAVRVEEFLYIRQVNLRR